MSALIGPEQLQQELRSGAPLLLDVRWTLAGSDRAGYLAGHLPGAVFCDLDADLAGPPGSGGRHPLPERRELAASFARLGVRPATSVVVYDGGVAAAAARAWWCLRWIGHQDVRVLDGGLPAWQAAGGPLETGDMPPQAAAPARAASTPDPSIPPHTGAKGAPAAVSTEPPSHIGTRSSTMPTRTAEDIVAGHGGVLLDARAPERFRGEAEPIDPVAGHIPGARSLPTARLLDSEGRYLPGTALRELFAEAGAVGEQPVAAYCGSGITAAQLVLAAHEAGIEAALYPGSWSHWITDPDRPVATGTA